MSLVVTFIVSVPMKTKRGAISPETERLSILIIARNMDLIVLQVILHSFCVSCLKRAHIWQWQLRRAVISFLTLFVNECSPQH